MPTGDYLEGAVIFGLMLAGTVAGAVLLRRRRLSHLTGAPGAVALGLLVVLALLAVHLAPAVVGLLSREAVLVATAIFLAAAWFVPAAASVAEEPPGRPRPEESRIAWVLAGLGAGFTAVFATAMLLDQAVLAPGSIDMQNFHLPGVGAWIDHGSIWPVDNFLADLAPGNYPNNGDVLLLAGVLPWSNDFLSHLAMYPVWVLAGAAVYALAIELRASRPAAVAAACLLLTIPVVTIPALVHSMPDVLLLASFATGVLFLVRHQRNGITAELVLAGLALGVAFGTKWYGVSSVAVVVGVWGLASLIARRPFKQVVGQGALLVALVLAAGGIWLLRNWIESDNPFFPVKLAPFGLEIFDAPRDLIRERFGFTIADYATDFEIWRESILPQYRDALAAAGVLIVAGFVVCLGSLAARWRRLERRGVIAALASATILVALVYSVTPYTAAGLEGDPVLVGADSRYLIPALVIAAALTAWAVTAWRWGPTTLAALAVPAAIDGARLASSGSNFAILEARQWIAGFVAVVVLAAAAWLVLQLRRRPPAPRARTAALVGAAVLGAAIAVVAGSEIQDRFNRTRYLGADPTTDYVLTQAGEHRVGLAGSWDNEGIAPPLPAFGPRYANEVEYVGEYVDGMMRGYESPGEFAEALERGDYDLVLVGRGAPPTPLVREERWAQSAGFERVVASERLALYRARQHR